MKPDHEQHYKPEEGRSWWRTRNGIATALLIVLISLYLVTEHLMHIYQALPLLLLGGCVLMHLFMHRGHGRRHRDNDPE